MTWMNELWSKIYGAGAMDRILTGNLDPSAATPLVADGCYIELYVESLRLEVARRFATRFHGVVYSFQSMATEGALVARLAAISKPDNLANLDKNALGKVITVSRKMMGAMPWRGGTLHLELGLFSVKSGNLLSPVLDFVTAVSTAAGASFIGAVTPFVPLMTRGMDLLAGQPEDVSLEVGLDADLALAGPGTFAVIAAEKGSIDPARITLDPLDRKLLLDGAPLQRAYCVFSIRATDRKADFGEIPELKDKYAALMAAIRTGRQELAEDALTAFRLAVLTCPDLIPADADRLVEKVRERMKKAFPGGGTARLAPSPAEHSLSSVALYSLH
jgi:hypothetical protein